MGLLLTSVVQDFKALSFDLCPTASQTGSFGGNVDSVAYAIKWQLYHTASNGAFSRWVAEFLPVVNFQQQPGDQYGCQSPAGCVQK